MKYFVYFTVFFVGAVLIGPVGILCPFLLFNYNEHNAYQIPYYIFSVYCIVFGALLIIVEFKIRFIVDLFLFIASYFYRAWFMIFLATLVMVAYSHIEDMEWVGYVIGAVIMIIGIMHISVGCFDRDWVREQNAKYLPKLDAAPPPAAAATGQSSIDAFYGQPPIVAPQQQQGLPPGPQQYPSLASDSAMMGGDPRNQMAATAAQMPETQRLAQAATQQTVQNMFSGQNAQDAAVSAFANPEVQSLAFNAGVAAARNPAMQNAAKNVASATLSNAYDQLFD